MNYSQQIVVRWIEYAAAGAILLVATRVAASRLKQPKDRINLIVTALFAAAIVTPLASIVPLPNWHLGVVGANEQDQSTRQSSALDHTNVQAARPEPMPGKLQENKASQQPAIETSTPSPSLPVATAPHRYDLWQISAIGLALCYCSVAVLFLINSAMAARALRQLANRARPADDAINDLWLATTDGRGSRARVLISQEITSPLVYGHGHPTVLIPKAIATGSVADLRFCLAHEWSHIANGDLTTWWFTWACQFPLWFQPLYWKLRSELRVCEDILADQRAAGAARNRIEYSELLLKLARLHSTRPLAGAISFLDPSSQLTRRVKMLVASSLILRDRSPRGFCVAVGFLALTAALVTGTVRLNSAVAADDTKTQATSIEDKAASNGNESAAESVEAKTVIGRVLDESGAPVAGAQLWLPLRYRPRYVAQATTDKSGAFEFKLPSSWETPLITNSSWTIWAYAPNHSIATASAFEQLRGKSDKPIEIMLGASSDCSFKVLSPAGEPLAGATVQPQNYKTGAGYDLVPEEMLSTVSSRTGADGIANLRAIQANPLFRVQVVTEEFGHQSLRVDRDFQDRVREIPLRAAGKIQGQLAGERPEWLKGVQLSFSTDNQDEWADTQGHETVTTDEAGRFVVPAIANGGPLHTYVQLDPALPVRPRLNDGLYVAAGDTLRLEVPLVAATRVFGSVRAKTSGKPVAKAIISLNYGGFRQRDTVVTDADGKFEGFALPGPLRAQCISLPEGFVQLGEPWAESKQVPSGVAEFELPTIEVVGTHAVAGRLIGDKDQPLAAMQLIAINGNRRYGFARTDSDGHFTMHVPDGIDTDFEVFSEQRGSIAVEVIQKDPLVLRYAEDATEQEVEKSRSGKADVILTGRVLSDGNPLAGVRVSLSRGIPVQLSSGAKRGQSGRLMSSGMRMDQAAKTETAADGTFRLAGLKAGDSYQLEVKPPFTASDPAWQHQSPWMPKLPDNAAGEVKLPDLKLRRLNQSLAGQVVDPDGKPVEGATVSAMLQDGFTSVNRGSQSGPPPWTTTDESGRFKLQQLPDEPLIIMAYINMHPKTGGPIRYPAKLSVERNQQDIRVVLDPSLVKEE